MDIISDLTAFLKTHTQASVGELGVFTKKQVSGYFDKSKKAFIPPNYIIEFNTKSADLNDEFLQFVSETNNLSIEESKENISNFSIDTLKYLEETKEKNLKGLGKLVLGDDKTISFEADKDLVLDTGSFGLPIVSEEETLVNTEVKSVENLPKTPPIIENIELDEVKTDLQNTLAHLNNEKEVEAEAKTEQPEIQNTAIKAGEEENKEVTENLKAANIAEEVKTTPIVEPPLSEEETESILGVAQDHEKSEPISPVEDITNVKPISEVATPAPDFIIEQHQEHPERFGTDPMEHPTEKSIWPKVGVTAIILVIIGVLLYYFQPNLFNKSIDQTKNVVAPVDTTSRQTAPIDSAKHLQDSTAKADSVLKANLVHPVGTDTVKGQNIANNEPTITFDIIVASFGREKDAEKYIASLKSKGYKAKIAHMVGTRKKISIASFQTEQEAKNQLIILKKKLKGKDFYVQKIKNP